MRSRRTPATVWSRPCQPHADGKQKATRAIRLPGRPRSSSLSVGERLSARSGSFGPPRRTLREVAVACFRHHRVRFECPRLAIPAVRAVRRGEDRRSYSLSSASVAHDLPHRSADTFSVSRMRDSSLAVVGPRGATHRPHQPLTFSLSPEGTPDPASLPSDALFLSSALADGASKVDPRVREPCVALPVKA